MATDEFLLNIYRFICHKTGFFACTDKWVGKMPGMISLLIVKYKCVLWKCSILNCTDILQRIKLSYIKLRKSTFEKSNCPCSSKVKEHHQHKSITKFWCLALLRNVLFGKFCLQFVHLDIRQLFREENFSSCYPVLNIGSGSRGSQKCSDNMVMCYKWGNQSSRA